MRPTRFSTILALTVAIIATSTSAPLTVYAAAPALAIAFYRNSIAVAFIAPVAVTGQRRAELMSLVRTASGRRAGLLCVLAGVCLAAHFGTWLPSAKLTSIANATALVGTQPVWAAVICVVRRIPVARSTWVGIAVAVVGVALATSADFAVSGQAVIGDLLAVVGAALAAIYTTFGEQARASLSTITYTLVCYTTCAIVLLGVDVCAGVRLNGYDLRTWGAILGIVIGAQLLGHSMINFALHQVSATAVSVLLLLQIPAAAALGWVFLGQGPQARSLPGLALGILGVAIVVLGAARTRGGQSDQQQVAMAATDNL